MDGGNGRAAHPRDHGPQGREHRHDGLVHVGPAQRLVDPQGDGRVGQPTGHHGPEGDQQPLHHGAGRPGKAETADEEPPLHLGTAAFLFPRLLVFLQGRDIGRREHAARGQRPVRPRVVLFQVVFRRCRRGLCGLGTSTWPLQKGQVIDRPARSSPISSCAAQ